MSDIAPIHSVGVDRLDTVSGIADRAAARTPARAQTAPAERPSDRVELSDRARYLSKLASLPDTRQDLIDRVRQEIAGGQYETPEKLDEAIANLLDDLQDHP
jgi:flagellar biosynthesis anti-sigma factor FlgM